MLDKNAKYMAARTGDFSKVQWVIGGDDDDRITNMVNFV